jgi:hypothetical protein
MPTKKPPFRTLKLPEMITVSKEILTLVAEIPKEEKHIHDIARLIYDDIAVTEELTGEAPGRTTRAEIQEYYLKRDASYSALCQCVSGLTVHPDNEQAEAASHISGILKEHHIPARSPMSFKSHTLNALMSDLDKEDARRRLEILRIGAIAGELKTTQQTVEGLRIKKAREDALGSAAGVNKIVDNIRTYMSDLAKVLDSKERLDPLVYKPIVDRINQVFTGYSQIAKSRRTRKSNAQESTEVVQMESSMAD